MLVLFRREDLAVSWPDDLGKALATLEDPVKAAVAGAARRRYGVADARSTGRIVFAVIDLPYAVVRRHLAEGTVPPPEVDEYVLAASRAVL